MICKKCGRVWDLWYREEKLQNIDNESLDCPECGGAENAFRSAYIKAVIKRVLYVPQIQTSDDVISENVKVENANVEEKNVDDVVHSNNTNNNNTNIVHQENQQEKLSNMIEKSLIEKSFEVIE